MTQPFYNRFNPCWSWSFTASANPFTPATAQSCTAVRSPAHPPRDAVAKRSRLLVQGAKALGKSLFLFIFSSKVLHAAFPDDFNGVVWIDPAEVATWPQTATLTVSHDSSALRVVNSKRNVWPARLHSDLQSNCCNASLWVFARFNGVWHATTFEYMRFGQVNKGPDVVNGTQAKRPPFLTSNPPFRWEPRQREVIAFMVSGMARFNLNNVNVRERSNVFLYKWGVGPVTEIDDEGISDDPPAPPPPPPVEECVEPEPENNTHVYSGNVIADINVTTSVETIPFQFIEPTTITVRDDRSLVMQVDSEQMLATVQPNGNFSGSFNLQEDIGPLECNVSVAVSGNVNGKSITGTGSGADVCGPYSAVLSATFSANSATEPSYLDERPPVPKLCVPSLAPIHDLLLQKDPS